MSDTEAQKRCVESFANIREHLHSTIVGMDDVMDALFWTLLCQGHALFIGVPGLAKTLLISTLSQLLGLQFSRVQFTPDMMPSDLIGGEILKEDRATGQRHFEFRKGPIFCQLLLADEINRTPPKTQSALLQAMQEGRVSFMGQSFEFEPPFVVFATQNPIESEGTYPLPEAQLDRFLFSIPMDYPSFDEEKKIVQKTTTEELPTLSPVMRAGDLLEFQSLVRKVPVEESLVEHAVQITRKTRPGPEMRSSLKEIIRFGAGPRASQAIVLASKARALLAGRYAVREEDLYAVAPFVLRHRLVLRRLREQTPAQVVNQLLKADR